MGLLLGLGTAGAIVWLLAAAYNAQHPDDDDDKGDDIERYFPRGE
jgi:hypothetical protein